MADTPNSKRLFGDRVLLEMAEPVNVPPAGHVVKFFDPDDGLPYWMDEDGEIHPYISLPDSLAEFDLTDDFVTTLPASGAVGLFGWAVFATAATFTAEAGHPGIVKLVTNDGVVPLNAMLAPATAASGFLPAESFTLTFLTRGTEAIAQTTWRWGLNGNASNDNPPSNGIYVEKLSTDSNFFLVTRSGGSQTRVDTGVAAVINTWYKFVLRRVSASAIGLSVNGSTEVTSSTNIPTGVVNLWIQHISVGGAGLEYIDTDYVRLKITGITR